MILIAPSILAADFGNLAEEARRAEAAGADWLHLDVMDGHFVPNISFGAGVCAAIRKVVPNMFLDAHLMISKPDIYLEDFISAGCNMITIHVEPEYDILRTIERIKENGIQAGIAINPETPISAAEKYFPFVDMVLAMSVHPGFGGQKFIPESVQKINQLDTIRQERGFSFLIEVDGGINASTAKDCVNAGVNVLVAGSTLYGASNMAEEISILREN